MDPKIEQSGEYWSQVAQDAGGSDDLVYWLAVPEIRWWINQRLTGNPSRLFLTDFLARIRHQFGIVPRILTVGCGTGDLERGVLLEETAQQGEGLDVAREALEQARRAASAAGLGDRLTYHQADALSFLEDKVAQGATYDIVFFHGSLHHIEAIEGVVTAALQLVERGRPGWVYVDEYVGPSRDGWAEGDLEFSRGLFSKIPAGFRRTPEVWPPIAMEDPTEMIRSSEIPEILETVGDVLERRPYFGNVVMPLVNAVKASAIRRPGVWEIFDLAMKTEDLLAAEGFLQPLYEIFVVRSRAGA